MKKEKSIEKYLPFWLEKLYSISLIPISIGLFLGILAILYTGKYNEYGFKLKDIFLVITGLVALPSIYFAFRDKRKNIRSEYIDRLVYKWHKEIIEISENPVSVFSTSIEEYTNFTKNDPKKILIDNQFQLIIDLISLIYTDIKRPDNPMNEKLLLNAWSKTFKDTVFKYELPKKLWYRKRETIDTDSRKWIECAIINDSSLCKQNTKELKRNE